MAFLKRSCVLWAVAASVAATPAGAAAASLESAVKASYLYKFAPFIDWPSGTLPTRDPFVICVIGSDDFGQVVEDAVRGQQIHGAAVATRRAASYMPDMTCHMLFAGGPSKVAAPALQGVARQPVLTVADDGPGTEGAMIRFVRQGGKVRFEINAAVAAASGFVISSKLLSLAVTVRQARL